MPNTQFGKAELRICDGFTVNTDYFSIHPNAGGTFDKVTEVRDEAKRPVTFRFRTCAPLRALAEHIAIDRTDSRTLPVTSETLTPGSQFSVSGYKIKVVGDNAGVGIYFVSASDPTSASKIIGMVMLGAGLWKGKSRPSLFPVEPF